MPDETPLQRLRRLEEEDQAPGSRGRGPAGKVAAGGGGLLVLLANWKGALFLFLGKLKFVFLAAKLLPLLGTLATMWVSVQVYSAEYGWSLAAGMVLLILIHELGHGAAALRLGLRIGAPVFIPFFGAVIAMKDQPRSTWVECLVAAAGPAAGLAGSAACAFASTLCGPDWAGYLLALSRLTAFINLFNLLPAAGLDGDRITKPFEKPQWVAALAGMAAICVSTSVTAGRLDAITFMVLAAGAVKAWRYFGGPSTRLLDRLDDAGKYPAEPETTPERRQTAAWVYLLLAGSLAALAA